MPLTIVLPQFAGLVVEDVTVVDCDRDVALPLFW